ncbi:hypothetical protein RHMOL_Rhmol03G0194400 [Rhododendron molle]|uniref:Uncharacterized protein n=1 Tax=Rhododendron molle TaxID=49168 RepID=A0ACC0PHK1_RHOML|nr:hypothetical protein RHMOL_Rhmol03G0194400 [Rhododendron molle]
MSIPQIAWNLTKGRVFIVTERLDCINETIHLRIKGKIVPIRIIEDPYVETSWDNRVVTTISVKKCHCMDSNELEENVQSKDGVEENEGHDLVKNIQSQESGYCDSKSTGDESKIDGSPSGCELSPITELQDGLWIQWWVILCFDSISGVGKINLALEDGEIAAENITPLLGVDMTIHDLASDVGEFDKGFWNLSKVSFLNQADMEVVELNPAQVKSIDGIQLAVDLDPVVKAKEKGKANWKQKSV